MSLVDAITDDQIAALQEGWRLLTRIEARQREKAARARREADAHEAKVSGHSSQAAAAYRAGADEVEREADEIRALLDRWPTPHDEGANDE